VLFVLGPAYFAFLQRFQSPGADKGGKRATSVYTTNIAIVALYSTLCWLFGTWAMISIYVTVYFIAVPAGFWLFYVQHQFEDTYWETHDTWDYRTAALHGSSYYRLPRVLEWITGSIGLHHVHHLDPKIPNYHLRLCHDSTPQFRAIPELTIRGSLRTVSLKLWDENQRRLVGFDAAADRERATSGTSDRTGTP
jgi:omega-6 fatty acid desaturase (delta-12 desaturase)